MARGNNVLQIIINGVNRSGPAFKQVGRDAARMGMVVSAALTAATVRAGKFEKGLAEISTLLDGDTAPAIRRIRGELMDLSEEFGQSIGKMTKARYDVISAGFTDAAESAIVLKSASKLAVAGVTDVAIAADLVTSALGGLQLEAHESERVIDVLFQTARKGKTDLRQLGQGFGKLFGTAKIAKVSLEELGAAMATSTVAGVKTQDSITGLRALMLALAAPTEEAKDALEDAGISMEEGFLQALIDVNKVAGDSPAKLRELIPSIEALQVAAAVAGNIGMMTENLEAMNDAAGVVNDGVAKMADTFDFKLNQAKRAVDNLVIEIGSVFLPVAKEMADGLRLIARGLRENDTELRAVIETVAKWAVGITAAGVALSTLGNVMTIVGPAIAGMGVAFATAAIPVKIAVVAIAGLIGILIKYRKELEEKLFPMAKKFNDEQKKTPGYLSKIKEAAITGLAQRYDEAALAAEQYNELIKSTGDLLTLPEMWLGNKRLEEFAKNARGAAKELRGLAIEGPAAIDTAMTDGIEKAGGAVKDGMDGIAQTVEDSIAGMVGQIQTLMSEMVRAQMMAEKISEGFIPEPAARKPLGPEVPPGFRTPEQRAEDERKGAEAEAEARRQADEKAEATAQDRIDRIKAQMEDLAQFAAEDFMDMAFSIGSAFANVATQIGAHLFGLTKGPLMLGRAFKQMAVGIMSDLAQIIARMLVARALLSAFGGGGFLGGVFNALGGFSTGGVVPTAAAGFSVPGGSGQYFPPIILPGSPGMDRTPILAQGGEVVLSRPDVNAMRSMTKQPQVGPRRDRGGSRRKMKVKVDLQANRPFRREEQVLLTDSVQEGFDRSARYGS